MESRSCHPDRGFLRSLVGHSPSMPVEMGRLESGRLTGFACQGGLLAAGIGYSFSAELKSIYRAFDEQFNDREDHRGSAFAAHCLAKTSTRYWLLMLIRCAFAGRCMTTDRAFDRL